jgi:hypothetical protein
MVFIPHHSAAQRRKAEGQVKAARFPPGDTGDDLQFGKSLLTTSWALR